jgi:hypothetical protein
MNPNKYEEYREASIESGRVYQDFVVDALQTHLRLSITVYNSRIYQQQVGESAQGFEIKNDKLFHKTGRLYIELAEKARPRDGMYAKSGINRSDNTVFYVIGDFNTIYLFQKSLLHLLYGSERYRVVENGTKTSLGFLLPVEDANKYAAAVLTPNAEQKIASVVRLQSQCASEMFAELNRKPTLQLGLSFDNELRSNK